MTDPDLLADIRKDLATRADALLEISNALSEQALDEEGRRLFGVQQKLRELGEPIDLARETVPVIRSIAQRLHELKLDDLAEQLEKLRREIASTVNRMISQTQPIDVSPRD